MTVLPDLYMPRELDAGIRRGDGRMRDDLEALSRELAAVQNRFVDLLARLTRAGAAEWVQADCDPGFVYCLIGGELVVFECLAGDYGDEPVPPGEPLAGVTADCRNATYMWAEGAPGWEQLLALLRAAPNDDARYVECRRLAHGAPVRMLEEMLGQAGL